MCKRMLREQDNCVHHSAGIVHYITLQSHHLSQTVRAGEDNFSHLQELPLASACLVRNERSKSVWLLAAAHPRLCSQPLLSTTFCLWACFATPARALLPKARHDSAQLMLLWLSGWSSLRPASPAPRTRRTCPCSCPPSCPCGPAMTSCPCPA